jgi:NDP-sugar pyrophosphorylase family protein
VTLPKKSLRSAAGTFKSAKSEVERLLGDASKARKLLGWQPKKDIYRSPFGVLSIANGEITGIVEKPSHEFPISAGIYCVKSTALPFVPAESFFTVPELIQRLLAAGKSVSAYHIQESWIGLESTEHFEDAVKELRSAPKSNKKFSSS